MEPMLDSQKAEDEGDLDENIIAIWRFLALFYRPTIIKTRIQTWWRLANSNHEVRRGREKSGIDVSRCVLEIPVLWDVL